MTTTDATLFFIILGAAFLLLVGGGALINNYLELLDERHRNIFGTVRGRTARTTRHRDGETTKLRTAALNFEANKHATLREVAGQFWQRREQRQGVERGIYAN